MKNRAEKIRFKLKQVSKRNRLSVFKSNMHIYAQLIDDSKGVTLASVASIQPSIKEKNLPEVDDNFAKLMDPSINDLKELKKQIKKNSILLHLFKKQ